jgi:hypothetical protein
VVYTLSDPMNYTESDRTADAWEGDAGLTGQASENFNAPASLPGFGVNSGVPGAVVRPGEEPVPGARLNDAAVMAPADTDGITANLPMTQVSQFQQAADQMATNMQSTVENLSGLTANVGANIPPMPNGVPDQTAAPNPLSYSPSGGLPDPAGIGGGQLPGAGPMASPGVPGGPDGAPDAAAGGTGGGGGGGYLSATVRGATDSLTSAVAAAASSSGPHAALVAGTVVLSGLVIMAGGMTTVGSHGAPASIMALGSEGGSAPQFASDTQGWFSSAVAAWAAANPPPPLPPPQAGAAGPPVTGAADSSPAPPPTSGGPVPMPSMTPADMIPGAGSGANIPGQFATAGPTASDPMPADMTTTPAATNQSVGGAVMGKVDDAIGSFDHPGTPFNSEAWTGQSVPNEGVWDNMGPGIMSHGAVLNAQAKDLAQGGQGLLNRASQGDDFAGYRDDTGGPITYANADDAAYVAQTMRSLGADPTGKFTTDDAVAQQNDTDDTHSDTSGVWSSPV